MGWQPSRLSKLYFGKDDAESDIAAGGLLRQGFLETTAYQAAMSGRKQLIIGRKGSGKSAICVMLAATPAEPGQVSLVTPDEISAEEIRRFELEGITPEQSKALLWRYVLAVRLAKSLLAHAQSAHGTAKPPESVTAVRKFLLANGEVEDPNFQEKFWKVIQRIKSSLSLEAFGIKLGVDVEAPTDGIRVSHQLEVVEQNVRRAIDELGCGSAHGPILLLVDQIEKVWSNDRDSDAMVVGLLLAARHASALFPAVRCVVFLRSDIYDLLQFQDRDKFHGDELLIDWNEQRLLDLVLARARASAGQHLGPGDLWGGLFPGRVRGEPTPRFIVSRTLMRPRDIIQLCNACRDTAEKNGHDSILAEDVEEATAQYSGWKLEDLINEYRVNYPFLKDLLVLFQHGSYLVTRSRLDQLLRQVGPTLAARYPDYVNAFNTDIVLDVLYGIGFLGVVRGGRSAFSYEDPSQVAPHEAQFVIHPCFREALRSVSSVDVQPFEPVAVVLSNRLIAETRGRYGQEGSPQLRGRRSARWQRYAEEALGRVWAALPDADLPGEVREEIKHNLLVAVENLRELDPYAHGWLEVSVEQWEFARKTCRFLRELRDGLAAAGLAAGGNGARFARVLELAAAGIERALEREYS